MDQHSASEASPNNFKVKAFNEAEKKSEYWLQHGKDFVENHIKSTKNTKKARNVIMFLGDGLSHATIGK